MLGLESQIFDEKTWKTAENPGAKHGATHEKLWKTWSKTWKTSGRKGRFRPLFMVWRRASET